MPKQALIVAGYKFDGNATLLMSIVVFEECCCADRLYEINCAIYDNILFKVLFIGCKRVFVNLNKSCKLGFWFVRGHDI